MQDLDCDPLGKPIPRRHLRQKTFPNPPCPSIRRKDMCTVLAVDFCSCGQDDSINFITIDTDRSHFHVWSAHVAFEDAQEQGQHASELRFRLDSTTICHAQSDGGDTRVTQWQSPNKIAMVFNTKWAMSYWHWLLLQDTVTYPYGAGFPRCHSNDLKRVGMK